MPPTVTSSDDAISNAPVETSEMSRVCRDNDSDASTYARPVTKLALSPAKARTDPPASNSAVSVARDTESPEYAEMREPARTFTSSLDTSSTSATSTSPDSASIDSTVPDDTDIAPLLSIETEPAETEARPPVNTSTVSADTDTRSDIASISSTDSTLTTSPITDTVSPLPTSTLLPAERLTVSELTLTDSPDVNSRTLVADTLTRPDPTTRPKWNTT